MRRRTIISVIVAIVVAGSLLGAVVRAGASGAPGASAKPTIKVIVVLKSHGDGGEVVNRLAHDHATGVYRYRYFSSVAATVSRATLGELLRDGNVLNVVSDRKVRVPTTPGVGTRVAKTGRTAGQATGATARRPRPPRRRPSNPKRCSSPTPKTPGPSR